MAFIKSSPGLSCKTSSNIISWLFVLKQQIPLVLVGYGMILTNSVLHDFLDVHHIIFNARLSPKVKENNGPNTEVFYAQFMIITEKQFLLWGTGIHKENWA